MAVRLRIVVLAFLSIAAPAAAAPLCTLSVVSVPVLSSSSTAAAPGDLMGTCSDLSPGPIIVDFSYFFNTAVVQTGTPTLTTDLSTVYSGIFAAGNEVQFLGVSLIGPTPSFTIDDIFVNPSLLSPPASVVSFLSGPGLAILNPQNVVAQVVAVPEPATIALLGLGVGVLLGTRRRRTGILSRATTQDICRGFRNRPRE